MLKNIVPYGSAHFDAAVSDIITVFSLDSAKVYIKPTATLAWVLLGTTVGGIEYVSSGLSAASAVRIEAGGREVIYNFGVAPAVLQRRGFRGQPTPGVLDASASLTPKMILSGIVTSAAATVQADLPIGADMDAAIEMEIGDSFDWAVIKTGANDLTVTADTDHAVVGLMVVKTVTSALFRTVKIGVADYVTYSLAIAAS